MGNLIEFCLRKDSLPKISLNFACCNSKIVDECDGDINNEETTSNLKWTQDSNSEAL